MVSLVGRIATGAAKSLFPAFVTQATLNFSYKMLLNCYYLICLFTSGENPSKCDFSLVSACSETKSGK